MNMLITYIYAFGKCFYPKWLTWHSGYTFDYFMPSLGIKPMALELLAPCSSVCATGGVCVPASEFRNAFCILQSESFAISFHIVSCLIIPSIKWQNGKYKKQLPLFSSGDLRSDLYHTNKTDPLEYGLLSSVCPIWQPHSKINQFKCLLCCIDYWWQEIFKRKGQIKTDPVSECASLHAFILDIHNTVAKEYPDDTAFAEILKCASSRNFSIPQDHMTWGANWKKVYRTVSWATPFNCKCWKYQDNCSLWFN